MKAVEKFDDGYNNMKIVEIPEPVATGDLVKVQVVYTGVCGTDLHTFNGTYPSTKTPVVLGHEFSGIVASTGPLVKDFEIGDRVTSETTFTTCGVCPQCQQKDYNLCSNRKGIGTQVNGSLAEYVLTREESVHKIPHNVSLLSASLTEPLSCSVHACIEKGEVKQGEIICIFGVGAIGLLLAQIAKAQGAFVILAGIDTDSLRLEMGLKIGADKAVDQTKEDLNEYVASLTDGNGVDKVFECSGSVHALNKGLGIVKKMGRVIQMGVFSEEKMLIATDLILHKEIEYIGSRSQKPSSWEKSIDLLAQGKVAPELIVSKIVMLDDWQSLYEQCIEGTCIKGVIQSGKDPDYVETGEFSILP